jgi:hypothetical protein
VNCFKCLKQLDLAFPDSEKFENGREPHDGLIFSATGNYGSRVYDPTMSAPALVVWICDECIVEHKELVQMRRYMHQNVEVVWTDFDPEGAHW